MQLKSARGFSLIELMVTITVLGILLAAAIPAFGRWIANASVRSAGESLQNGLRLAQAEAMRRNRQAVLVLTDAAPALDAAPVANGRNWYVQVLPLVNGERTVANQDQYYVHGSTLSTHGPVTVTGANSIVCFNSVGRQVSNAAVMFDGATLAGTCTAPAAPGTPITYDITRTGADRRLRVQLFLGGRIRMCDPDKAIATNADGC